VSEPTTPEERERWLHTQLGLDYPPVARLIADVDRLEAERDIARSEAEQMRDEYERIEADRVLPLQARNRELEEALRAWDEADEAWFLAADARPYDPERAAQASEVKRKAQERLRAVLHEQEADR
jgi:hypothetical protein